MTDEEIGKLLRDSKAGWQEDGLGLRGSPTRFEPLRASALEPTQPFEIKETVSSIGDGKPVPNRPNLDSTYDVGADAVGDGGQNQQVVFGAVNGVPATLTVFATGPWTPV